MHDIPELDRKGLRRFGLIFGGIIGVVFGILLPWIWGWRFRTWPWLAAVVFVSLAMAAPGSLNPFYRLWMHVGLAINWVVTRCLMSAIFFGVMLPMGMIMRIRKWDPMARRFDPDKASYRVASKPVPNKNMERPF